MYILRVVIFSLDEPNLTQILTVFKENLVKYKGKRTSQDVVFIVFSSLNTYALKTRQITSLWVQDKFLILEKSFAYPRSLKEDYPHV